MTFCDFDIPATRGESSAHTERNVTHTTVGDIMLNFEHAADEIAAPTTGEAGLVLVEDVAAEPTGATLQEPPVTVAARMLELAAVTADRLVSDARTEADSLVSEAQAHADAIAVAGRDEAERVAAELARTREEQVAELDRERATALAGLAEEQAALEAQIATLRATESDQRNRMRQHLTQHLSMLETTEPEAPAAIAG